MWCCWNVKHDDIETKKPETPMHLKIAFDPHNIPEFKVKTEIIRTQIGRIYDGDTMHVIFPRNAIIPTEHIAMNIRVLGIDTPETKPKKKNKDEKDRTKESIDNEKKAAQLATEMTKRTMQHYKIIEVEIVKEDKFGGRYLGNIYLRESETSPVISYADLMIKYGHARPYNGDKKIDFEEWYDEGKITHPDTLYNI